MPPKKKSKKAKNKEKKSKFRKRLFNPDDSMNGMGSRIFNEICEKIYPIYHKYMGDYDKNDLDTLSINATLHGLGWGYMLHVNREIMDIEEKNE